MVMWSGVEWRWTGLDPCPASLGVTFLVPVAFFRDNDSNCLELLLI